MRVVAKFFPPPTISGVDPTAVISPSARLHPSVAVGAFSSIGDCTIGEGSVIMNNVHIYSGVTIGKHVIIHSGTVIGADGFGFQRNKEGLLEKFPHIGGVRIGDNVEIGSNTSIDRGTLDDTVIGNGSKIDNLVHIAHNVRIGQHSLVIAHAMIAGGVVIGDGAWVAPNVAVREQLTIGNNATVGLAAVVVKDVAENTTVAGAPAVELEEFKAQLQALKKLRSSSQ
jgi:UDP-3-O-[3-hydroxymyristoyl] glucosamine N-acyltransferase